MQAPTAGSAGEFIPQPKLSSYAEPLLPALELDAAPPEPEAAELAPAEPEPVEPDAPLAAALEPAELDDDELSAEAVDEPPSPPSLLLAPAAAGFAEEYRSLYQPPPLKLTAAAVIVLSSAPPQWGHSVSGASENFWIFSTRRPQLRHSYSYKGIAFRCSSP